MADKALSLAKGARALDPDGLNVKERIFVGRYLIHGQKHRAAREAGLHFTDVEGKRHRCSVWNWRRVKEVIDRELADRRRRYKLEAEWVLEQLAYMVRFDPRTLVDETNAPKPLWELEESAASCIAGFEVEENIRRTTTSKGTVTQVVSRKFKYKIASRTEAILMAMKHLRLLGENQLPAQGMAPPVLNVQFVSVNQLKTPQGQPESPQAGIESSTRDDSADDAMTIEGEVVKDEENS